MKLKHVLPFGSKLVVGLSSGAMLALASVSLPVHAEDESREGESREGASLGNAAREDASLEDASPGDAALGDASLEDASPGDASPGDASLGDASLENASPGDASLENASPGDGSLDDWPCVQRYIPEIRPASFWPLPIPEALAGSWRSDERTADLARQLGEQTALDESSVVAMDTFAESWPAADREMALSRLADGIVAVADQRRARYLDGIRRYTRQQMAIAGQIESTLNELGELEDAGALGMTRDNSVVSTDEGQADGTGEPDQSSSIADATTARADIEETLVWHQRLYDQRERAMRSLCDRPVELEQSLSEVLRELSYRLP